MGQGAVASTGEERALLATAARLGIATALEHRLFGPARLSLAARRSPPKGAAEPASPGYGDGGDEEIGQRRAAGPPGLMAALGGVEDSWLASAVQGEPLGLVAAVVEREEVPLAVRAAAIAAVTPPPATGVPAPDARPWALPAALAADVERMVFGALEPLTEPASGPLGAYLSQRTLAELQEELARWGARTVGASLAGGPFEVRARAMASVGAPWAAEIAAAAGASPPPDAVERDRARRWVASAANAGAGVLAAASAAAPIERLRGVGLLALGHALAEEGPGSLHRVAGRLPVRVGRALVAAAQRGNEPVHPTVDLP